MFNSQRCEWIEEETRSAFALRYFLSKDRRSNWLNTPRMIFAKTPFSMKNRLMKDFKPVALAGYPFENQHHKKNLIFSQYRSLGFVFSFERDEFRYGDMFLLKAVCHFLISVWDWFQCRKNDHFTVQICTSSVFFRRKPWWKKWYA